MGVRFLQNSFNGKKRFLVLEKREIFNFTYEVRNIYHNSVGNYIK